jgi:hypothetical protein
LLTTQFTLLLSLLSSSFAANTTSGASAPPDAVDTLVLPDAVHTDAVDTLVLPDAVDTLVLLSAAASFRSAAGIPGTFFKIFF